MQQKVSVFMPCYNCEKYLGDSIESILSQTYKDFELVILDDGSLDNSAQIIQEFAKRDTRIKFYTNEINKGIIYTRNKGLELCNCEYVALMDADDIAPKGRLEREVRFLQEHSDIDAVGGLYQLIDEDGNLLKGKLELVQDDAALRACMMFYNPIANGTMMFRRQFVVKNQIKYREELCSAEDYRFWSEVLMHGKMYNLDAILQFYRVHADSLENSAKKESAEKRNKDLYVTKRYLFENLGYHLNDEDMDFFLTFLCNPKYDLKIQEKMRLRKILLALKKQKVSKDEKYNYEIQRMLAKYQMYTKNRLYRGLKRIWSL